MRLISTIAEPKILSPAEVDDLAERLAEACPRMEAVLMYLHGAHARGTQGQLSDLDLAVLLDQQAGRDGIGDGIGKRHLDLIAALQELCGREDVDLVLLNRAGPIIKDRVVRHGRLIYARSEAERVRFEAGAIMAALDFQHFSRVYDDALFRQLREGRFLG